eukprot:CAMPEP_0172182298 /NCGR_PEP_ID=MMETSP1050-20130122/18324_1 /TAXON_ID=233186 /ORGANISM="Cryptomonas curvata, Strain CCAP979/52" /LENGTH=123 /DNA_ID=CAMNT_0012855733 /DNA_START=502 /DNA_END=870 /DNA_ORIENTATION=+
MSPNGLQHFHPAHRQQHKYQRELILKLTEGVQNLLIKREANIKAALALKAQLQDSEGMLESQNHALNLRIDQLSSERDRMANQIAVLQCDLKTAVADKGCLAVEKSSAEQRLRELSTTMHEAA